MGSSHFERNIGDVVRRITGDGIPVYIGTIVSNIVSQRPLGTDEAAFTAFDSGRKLLERGETNRAREAFSRARDLDNITFRAPSAINDVIREMSKESGVIVVDLEPSFKEASDLFIDHLHPTYEGYRLIAQAFFDRVKLNPGLRENQIGVYRDPLPDVDPFEKRLTGILIERLLSDYPFTKEATQQEISTAYSVLLGRNRASSDVLDSLAAAVLSSDMSIQEALLIGARRALAGQDELRAVQLYNSLVRWQPFNESFLKEIVSWAVQNAELDPWTSRMAFFSARRTNDEFHWNSLAASLIRTGRVEDAEKVLDISENLAPDDPIMLYNRARSAAMRGDTTRARMYFERFQKQQAAIH